MKLKERWKVCCRLFSQCHSFIQLHVENSFLPLWFFSLCFVYPCQPRSIIIIQTIHADLQCGCLSCRDKEFVWEPGRWRHGWGRKVNWLGRYFCWLEPSVSVTIISVISSSATHFCCILGQTSVLCVCVFDLSTLSLALPITRPDWIYANWTKIKRHLGDPSWDGFEYT